MGDYITYHNPDKRGFLASESTVGIFTNKTVSQDVSGSTIWLITGEGHPRKYSLAMSFIADVIESGEDEHFRTRILGRDEQRFVPMVPLDDFEWFKEFRRAQANFSFGFGVIKDPRVVQGFQSLAAHDAR